MADHPRSELCGLRSGIKYLVGQINSSGDTAMYKFRLETAYSRPFLEFLGVFPHIRHPTVQLGCHLSFNCHFYVVVLFPSTSACLRHVSIIFW